MILVPLISLPQNSQNVGTINAYIALINT